MLLPTYSMLLGTRAWLRSRFSAMSGNDRGDAYSGTMMVVFGVAVAIAVGGILMVKFSDRATEIDVHPPDTTYTGTP